MIFSTSSFNRSLTLAVAAGILLFGCGASRPDVRSGFFGAGAGARIIAVLPADNLSGRSVPRNDMRQFLANGLDARGFKVVPQETVELFMERHRLRNTGGIDAPTAKKLREETGAAAVLITTVELYTADTNVYTVPKVSLLGRLVTTDDMPVIEWMDSAGMTGDESPGLLGLGLVSDPQVLMKMAAAKLLNSLTVYRDGGSYPNKGRSLAAKVSYRSPLIGLNMRECSVEFALRRNDEAQAKGAQIYVYLSTVHGRTVTVEYRVTGGTARAGKDYVLKPGTLTFEPGETVKTIDLEVKPARAHDDDRTVEVSLFNAKNAVLGEKRLHTYLIKNTVPMPTVSFNEASRTVNEDSGTIMVPVRLSALSGKDV
ncbi:MAG: Calx-beta domain-containing protein, partial [Nitrospirota bacterium]